MMVVQEIGTKDDTQHVGSDKVGNELPVVKV